jgi:hypothetical protein
VVECSTHYPKTQDSKPATDTGRETLGKSKRCGCVMVAQWLNAQLIILRSWIQNLPLALVESH